MTTERPFPQHIAIVSDTHGKLDSQVAELVAGCDIAVHGGDIGCASVLGQLQPRGGRVYAVYGNNDTPRSWPAEERHHLSHLPEVVTVPLAGGQLVVIHGHQYPAAGRHRQLRRRFPEARAIVYGHSHHLFVDTAEIPWILNPGAAGRVRTYGGPSCLVLTVSAAGWSLSVHRFALPRYRPGRARRKPDKEVLSA